MKGLKKSYVVGGGQFSNPLPVGKHLVELEGYGLKLKRNSKDTAIAAKLTTLRTTLQAMAISEIIDTEADAEKAIAICESVTIGLPAWQAFWGFSYLKSSDGVQFQQGNIKGINEVGKAYEIESYPEEWKDADGKLRMSNRIRLVENSPANDANVQAPANVQAANAELIDAEP